MGRPLPTQPAGKLRRRRRQLKRFFPNTPLAHRIEILPELGLVYVRNPKAASSTLLEWLDWMHTGVEREATRNIRQDNSLPKARDLGWERVMRMVDGEAFRFSFVRDPVTRFESAYRSKILQPRPSRLQVLELLGRPDDPATEVTFEDFLGVVEQQDPLHMDLHWRPQHLNLMHPVFTFDLLGRVERFDQDIEEIRRRLDLPGPPTRSRNVKRSPGPSAYEGRPDLVERVRALYTRDLELYSY
jgi:Sulfotransferase family